MKKQIIEIIEKYYDPDTESLEYNKTADDILTLFKKFILWSDNPHCPFNHCYNGLDKTKPEVCYERGNKHYSIEEVFEWYFENVK
jgi:hypothetical protein